MRAIALISGRIFVGPSLNRNQQWIDTSTNFVLDLFKAGEVVRKWPPSLVPLAVKLHVIPEVEKVRRLQKQASALLVPLMKQRREA